MSMPEHLRPLGYRRLRLLSCLGGDMARSPGFFDPPPDTDIFAAYRSHVLFLSREFDSDEPMVAGLLAAARLLAGDIASAVTIIDLLPEQPVKLDHGAGYCRTEPLHALNNAFPLPAELRETQRWLRGSPEQAALRAWLDDHSHKLVWIEAEARFQVEY